MHPLSPVARLRSRRLREYTHPAVQEIRGGTAYEKTDIAVGGHAYLSSASRFTAGQVTFGKIVVHTSAEWDMRIPESISKSYEVYGLEFAVSFRELDPSEFEKLIFNVSIPADSIAFELVPLRYDRAITETVKDSTKAGVTAKLGATEISVGRVFERDIAFQHPIPTLIADGLRESSFAWTMTDEAVQPGSKKFVAFVGVPKGTDVLQTKIWSTGRTKKSLFAMGNILSTAQDAQMIRLR